MMLSDMRKFYFFTSAILLFINTCLYGQKYVGAAKNDKFIQKAIKATIQDAENGDAESQYCIGMHYLNGIFLEKDTQTAIKWLEKAKYNHYAKSLEFLETLKIMIVLQKCIINRQFIIPTPMISIQSLFLILNIK